MRPHRRQPTRLPCPWDSPGKNIGVGCHFLLQCMKEKSESEVAQSCPTLSDPMDCSLPGSSVHGIFQARVLEWGAIASSDLHFAARLFLLHIFLFLKINKYFQLKRNPFKISYKAGLVEINSLSFCFLGSSFISPSNLRDNLAR